MSTMRAHHGGWSDEEGSIDFMAPMMMRVAWFCTLLTRSKLDLAVVPHAVMPYSSTGLTLPVYSLLRVTVSAPHVVPARDFLP